MTNENISGFLNSIAEAKRAFDAEPEYQSRIAELERDKQRLGETVASRELRIHNLKQEHEVLTQRLRSAEVERDDAGFRALEEADRVSALLTLVRGFVSDGLKAISAIEGQEQIVVSRAALDRDHDVILEQRGTIDRIEMELQQLRDDMRLAQEQLTRPFASTPTQQDTSSSPVIGTDPWSPETMAWDADIGRQLVEGQSVVNPTTSTSLGAPSADTQELQSSPASAPLHEGQSDGPFASADITQTTQSETASSQSATVGDGVVLNVGPPERNRDESTRFKGRKYYDVTYFVPLHEWLSKGGTREDYDWRPLPEVNRASNFS